MSVVGRSVRLFLVEGSPSGVITAEVVNWTGNAIVAPRAKLDVVLQRPEADRTGVYFLFGEMAGVGLPRSVYVGESDNVGRRILQHSQRDEIDFDRFCFLTSKDLNLTKAHARYLESRLSAIAQASGRADVRNRNSPPEGSLPESDIADMEYFIEQTRIVLPVLGFDILKEPFVPPAHLGKEIMFSAGEGSRIVPVRLIRSRRGLVARGAEQDGELTVFEGSLAEADPNFASNQYGPLRRQLIDDGTLRPTDDSKFLRFSRNRTFSSPSAAAAVIYGRSANGRTAWELANYNITLKEFYNRQAEAVEE